MVTRNSFKKCDFSCLIGTLISKKNNFKFIDADDFHPVENISKMSNGIALNDEDRKGWLESIGKFLMTNEEKNQNFVLACSALKHQYRQSFLLPGFATKFVLLNASFDVIKQRLSTRENHFMDDRLLKSQFETLDLLTPIESDKNQFQLKTILDSNENNVVEEEEEEEEKKTVEIKIVQVENKTIEEIVNEIQNLIQ